MELIKKYKHILTILVSVLILFWVYNSFFKHSKLDEEISEFEERMVAVDQFVESVEYLRNVELSDQIFQRDVFQNLTSEFERDIPSAPISRSDPFAPF